MTALTTPLAKLCAGSIESHRLGFDLLVPVPLHGIRQRTRGYNQAELLAKGIAAELSVPVDARGLRRSRQTAQQARTADIDQRRRNVEGAFRASLSRFRGRSICLVDDVTTTGATLAACSKALKQGGAKLVWAFALARED
jgi:ComF family protein